MAKGKGLLGPTSLASLFYQLVLKVCAVLAAFVACVPQAQVLAPGVLQRSEKAVFVRVVRGRYVRVGQALTYD